MNRNKFKFNADKTHLMVMGTAKRLQMTGQLNVVMDGVVVVIKWSMQIKTLTEKLKKRLAGLEKLKYIMSFATAFLCWGVVTTLMCMISR